MAHRRPADDVRTLCGGPIGNGYVRVFALPSGEPLQTMGGHPAQQRFGVSLVDLGDRDGDSRRELGVTALRGDGIAEFFVMTLRDAFPDGRQTPTSRPRAATAPAGVLPK